MKLIEVISRVLTIEDGDKVKNVMVTASPDVEIYINRKNQNKLTCTNALLDGNCEVDKLSIYNQGEATLFGSGKTYQPHVHELKILAGGRAKIKGVAEIDRLSIQSHAVLFCSEEFLKMTKDIVLAFEKEATVTICGTKNGESWSRPYTYMAKEDENEHQFIDRILHPQIVYNPNPLACVQVRPKED